ncbi:N-Acetyl-D-glucosamine ABC transport system, permease protein 2 [hydrothermal vent metagenome]|jgi:multiple sugar transport system permease protein|uniref:N-Acetyl-D-glucosamine ABC transport system, permease protein 2 n=1 Tax=hydrothermal vent metagenome TaxID=652676 RepID=A0A3B0RZN5_9ZZZZ
MRKTRVGLIGAGLTVGALLTSFPFIWMVFTSLKPLNEARTYPPKILPSTVDWDSYLRLFRELDFGRYTINTIIVVMVGFIGMFFMAMAGYGFAKFEFRGRKAMFLLVLTTLMIPVQVTLIPTYLILNSVGLTNTVVGIAMPTLVSAFGIFLFRQFMETLPTEILDAARLDGASEFRIFLSVALPMSTPILAVMTILTFIAGWNSFIWPLVIAGQQKNYTLSVGLALLNQQVSINPALQMAGASLMVIPTILLFVMLQRYIVQGFTMSGIN